MRVHVTDHAIDRYLERVGGDSRADAQRALSTSSFNAAASFGASFVKLATGHRAVIENGCVITVLPDHSKPHQYGWKRV